MIYSVRLICTTAISLGSSIPFKTLDWLLSPPVDHSWQPVALKWDRECLGLLTTVFARKILFLKINHFFLIKKPINFKSNKMLSKYKTMFILLINVHSDFRGGWGWVGFSNRNDNRGESVETGTESVKTRDKIYRSRGGKHSNHVIIKYNTISMKISMMLTVYRSFDLLF